MGALRDLDEVFAQLSNSAFRRRFRLAAREREYMQVRGRETVLGHARGFIAQRLAAAHPVNDGKQTPFRGHPVFIAQHATATCCRGCLSKWHGIPAGRPLTAGEQDHVVAAIERWLGLQASLSNTGGQQSSLLL
jgi:predicted Fe-S protein YdhL (DUF1289 family)